jgi:hypothetical protein
MSENIIRDHYYLSNGVRDLKHSKHIKICLIKYLSVYHTFAYYTIYLIPKIYYRLCGKPVLVTSFCEYLVTQINKKLLKQKLNQ